MTRLQVACGRVVGVQLWNAVHLKKTLSLCETAEFFVTHKIIMTPIRNQNKMKTG